MKGLKKYFLSFLIILNFGKICESTTTCPAGAVVSLNNPSICYSLLTSQTEYLNAEQTCVDLGGHLASVDSAFTNTFLVRKFQVILKETYL